MPVEVPYWVGQVLTVSGRQFGCRAAKRHRPAFDLGAESSQFPGLCYQVIADVEKDLRVVRSTAQAQGDFVNCQNELVTHMNDLLRGTSFILDHIGSPVPGLPGEPQQMLSAS